MNSDQKLIEMWLSDKRPLTRKAYASKIKELTTFCDKSLAKITKADLVLFRHQLPQAADNSKKLTINAVKSLFTFASKNGLLPENTARALDGFPSRLKIAERILSEDEVEKIIAGVSSRRDRLFIRMLYATGARVSEITSLKWRDLKPQGDGAKADLHGKGQKDRTVKISPALWKDLQGIRYGAFPDEPVFLSRKGSHLSPAQAWRIVRAAAVAAGIEGNVSPHWFRHSHATHAIERGASLMLVRDSLGHSSLTVTNAYLHSNPDDSSGLHLKDF